MADKNQVAEAIRELQADAVRYHGFERNPEEFLHEIHRLGDERLREYLEQSRPFLTKRIEGVRQISPVVSDAVLEHCSGRPIEDDFTLLLIDRK